MWLYHHLDIVWFIYFNLFLILKDWFSSFFVSSNSLFSILSHSLLHQLLMCESLWMRGNIGVDCLPMGELSIMICKVSTLDIHGLQGNLTREVPFQWVQSVPGGLCNVLRNLSPREFMSRWATPSYSQNLPRMIWT